MSNSYTRFTPNFLGNAIIENDGKIEFLNKLSDWVEAWSNNSIFCLTKQTSKALTTTLKSQAMLMQELFEDGYKYVFIRSL